MDSILNAFVLALLTCFLDKATGQVHHVPDGMLNKCVNGTPNTVVQDVRLYRCLELCRQVTACESLDYNFKIRRCNLFAGAGADLGSLVTCQSFIHMDLVDWTEFHGGPCTTKPCQIHEGCVPNGESHVCDHLMDPADTETGTTSGQQTGATSGQQTVTTSGHQTVTTSGQQTVTTSSQQTTTRRAPCSMSMIESIPLPDSVFSASSKKSNASLPDDYYAPKWVRIETVTNGTFHGGGWIAGDNNTNQFFQVKLPEVYSILAVIMRGYHGEDAWVKTYRISYGTYCSNMSYIRNTGGSPMVFNANTDSDAKRFQYIYPNILAKCIRIHPVTWENQIAMRLELSGCVVDD